MKISTSLNKLSTFLLVLLLTTVLTLGGSLLASKETSAQLQFGIFQTFGGEITNVDYTSCTCTGLVLTIQDVRGQSLELMLYWSSIATALKREYQVYSSGPNALGLYSPGSVQCLAISTTGCSTSQTSATGYITLIGTSLQ